MEKDRDFLQTMKLEISKNFKLVPYERIAFHKLLGIQHSENGIKILLRDIYKEPVVRASAISVLKRVNSDDVHTTLMSLLNEQLSDDERMDILEHIELFGDLNYVETLIEFVESHRENENAHRLVSRALDVLRHIGSGSKQLYDYFMQISKNKEIDKSIRSLAIIGLSSFDDPTVFEKFLKGESDEIIFSTYYSISLFCDRIIKELEAGVTEDGFFTYQPEVEDRSILEMRVLLGKMTRNFDGYSDRIKSAFINAMISCNHREFIIYTMKALTSMESGLVALILYQIVSNVQKLRDPDKLFRNLIALPVDTEKGNDIIVEIFERYFNNLVENRKNNLLRDKMYNYIIVTLETYFETYRKEFMVKDVAEKSFPDDFQQIRHFILEQFNPTLKKQIINYLKVGDASTIHKHLMNISEQFYYLDQRYQDDLSKLIAILHEGDIKAREIAASRIESIEFEKRYLRDRIVRLCRIIGSLDIKNASTPLVKIYNYVKKYPDSDILDASMLALSRLNYSYMLGELEVMLTSGDDSEKMRCVQLLAQFSEQRTLNIMLDFIKDYDEHDVSLVLSMLRILEQRDLQGNVMANHILKRLIESSGNGEIKRHAILCIGRCGDEADIDYLNDVFYRSDASDPKDAIVLAIGYILVYSSNYDKRKVIRTLQEYLKDSGIKVRIYACSLLIQLGSREALRNIQDMMVIKNKGIQREILSIIGSLRSVDFAYFLISLLKEKYAISHDIIPLLRLLPQEELDEIDHFITNVFRKFEAPDFDDSPKIITKKAADTSLMKNLRTQDMTILSIEVSDFQAEFDRLNLSDKIIYLNSINAAVTTEIVNNSGVVSMNSNGHIICLFADPETAATVAHRIFSNVEAINTMNRSENTITISIDIIHQRASIINGEILQGSDLAFRAIDSAQLKNRIIIDATMKNTIERSFYCDDLPEMIFLRKGLDLFFYELMNPINFLTVSQDILNRLKKMEQERQELQLQLDAELKKRKREFRTPTSVTYAQAVDDLSKKLRLELNEINRYVQKRSTDRELLNTVDKMLNNVHKRFVIESSKIIME